MNKTLAVRSYAAFSVQSDLPEHVKQTIISLIQVHGGFYP